eukprot:scaffold134313_cov31-Attheya_sp.AAC.1
MKSKDRVTLMICTAADGTKFVPANLHMMYIPPNVTNTHQPADMGMIASMKVGFSKQPFLVDVNDVGARDWLMMAKLIF